MEGQNSAIKFRFHRGSLEEAMSTCVDVMTYQELFDLVYDRLGSYANVVTLEIHYYGYDNRIGWETYIVIAIDNNGLKFPIGFTNGKL